MELGPGWPARLGSRLRPSATDPRLPIPTRYKTLLTLAPSPPPSLLLSRMPPTDRTPLLENGGGAQPPKPFFARLADSLSTQGQPSWLHSYKFFIFGSYLNILLVFVPLSIISHKLNWDAALRFGFSFIAIMPLAAVRRLPPPVALYLADVTQPRVYLVLLNS